MASEVASRAVKIHTHKFELVWFAAPKPFDREGQALFGMVGDGQNAASEVVFGRPEMEQGLFRRAAYLPGQPGHRSDAYAVFTHLHRLRGGKFAEDGFQFCCKLHARDYKSGYLQKYYFEGIIGSAKRKANRSHAPRAAACSIGWECARKKSRWIGVRLPREAGCHMAGSGATRAAPFVSCPRTTPRPLPPHAAPPPPSVPA